MAVQHGSSISKATSSLCFLTEIRFTINVLKGNKTFWWNSCTFKAFEGIANLKIILKIEKTWRMAETARAGYQVGGRKLLDNCRPSALNSAWHKCTTLLYYIPNPQNILWKLGLDPILSNFQNVERLMWLELRGQQK